MHFLGIDTKSKGMVNMHIPV